MYQAVAGPRSQHTGRAFCVVPPLRPVSFTPVPFSSATCRGGKRAEVDRAGAGRGLQHEPAWGGRELRVREVSPQPQPPGPLRQMAASLAVPHTQAWTWSVWRQSAANALGAEGSAPARSRPPHPGPEPTAFRKSGRPCSRSLTGIRRVTAEAATGQLGLLYLALQKFP